VESRPSVVLKSPRSKNLPSEWMPSPLVSGLPDRRTSVAEGGASSLLQGSTFSNVRELASELELETKALIPRANVQPEIPRYDKNLIDFHYVTNLIIYSSLAILANRSPFNRKHVVSVKQFTREDLHILFGVAQEMKTIVGRQGSLHVFAGKVLCSAFYEPSTRTSSSFEAAMLRLGGSVVSIDQITSSIAKGESLGDTGI
jgi:carbamoyl-phosphate synthase / aspartate carbamoyltransferase